MIDDAIASLRRLFSASLAVLVVWLIAWPATREKLSLFSAAVELHEWVALKDRLSRLERSVFDTPADQPIAQDTETAEGAAADDSSADIVVATAWPKRRFDTVRLEPVLFDSAAPSDIARAYRVSGRGLPASWRRVYAVFRRIDPEREAEDPDALDDEPRAVEVGLVPADYPGFQLPRPGERQLLAALRDANFPASWEELRVTLLERGFDGDASALTRDDAALAGLRGAVDVRKENAGVAVLGVKLGLSQLFAGVGLVLSLQAFLALGPLLALRAAKGQRSTLSWIFVQPAHGDIGRRVLERAICVATVAWAAAPLGILAMQCMAYARLGSTPHGSFWPAALGLVASTLVFARIAAELRALRVTTAPRAERGDANAAESERPRAASLNPR